MAPLSATPSYSNSWAAKRVTISAYVHFREVPCWQLQVRSRSKSGYAPCFTPPTVDTSYVMAPGNNGGSDWGSLSADVRRGVIVANDNIFTSYMQLIPRGVDDAMASTISATRARKCRVRASTVRPPTSPMASIQTKAGRCRRGFFALNRPMAGSGRSTLPSARRSGIIPSARLNATELSGFRLICRCGLVRLTMAGH